MRRASWRKTALDQQIPLVAHDDLRQRVQAPGFVLVTQVLHLKEQALAQVPGADAWRIAGLQLRDRRFDLRFLGAQHGAGFVDVELEEASVVEAVDQKFQNVRFLARFRRGAQV